MIPSQPLGGMRTHGLRALMTIYELVQCAFVAFPAFFMPVPAGVACLGSWDHSVSSAELAGSQKIVVVVEGHANGPA
jgi:hypothetical protein